MNFISGYVLGARNASRAAGMSASAAQFGAQPTSKMLDMGDRIDRLVLVVEAMWSLMEDAGMTEGDLASRIEELDGIDGHVDGKKLTPARICPECEAAVGRGSGHCQFCGHELGEASPFSGV